MTTDRDRDPLARLYEVANDYETAVLDTLREKAGLTWECREGDPDGTSHWTNTEDAHRCARCGRPKPEAI